MSDLTPVLFLQLGLKLGAGFGIELLDRLAQLVGVLQGQCLFRRQRFAPFLFRILDFAHLSLPRCEKNIVMRRAHVEPGQQRARLWWHHRGFEDLSGERLDRSGRIEPQWVLRCRITRAVFPGVL